MSDVVISVEGLGKKYRLGANAGPSYQTVRESLIDAAKGPLRTLARVAGRTPEDGERGNRPEFWALKDVNFEVRRGEVLGIIGRNGAGKSTLLKILSQITEPTEGAVRMKGRVASLLEVGTGFHPELTGRENVFLNGAILGMGKAEIVRKFDEIVAFAEVEQFIDTPVKHYSSGMYLRLAFSVAAHLEPEILVVDEVLAVGDAEFQKKCMGKMGDVASQGRTVIFVSHNLAAVKRLCSRGLVLTAGKAAWHPDVARAVATYEDAGAGLCGHTPGVIYERGETRGEPVTIERVEILDHRGVRIAAPRTWESVRIRVWYKAERLMPRGSVVLWLRTRDGVTLVRASTSPDSNVSMDFLSGEHYVDCVFNSFPLAAGTYVVGVGLAHPNVAWLYRNDDAGMLTVLPEDVYQSGLAPTAEWALLAPEHRWETPGSDREGVRSFVDRTASPGLAAACGGEAR